MPRVGSGALWQPPARNNHNSLRIVSNRGTRAQLIKSVKAKPKSAACKQGKHTQCHVLGCPCDCGHLFK
jgi:hypothetical protein